MKSIEERLVGNGNLVEEARRAGRSISSADRRIILRARTEATAAGYTRTTINAYEMEGERGRRGLCSYPIATRFIGEQDACFLGFKLRLYNVEGDHPLNNSTVSAGSLLWLGLFPTDLSIFGLAREYLKEKFVDVCWTVQSAFQKIKGGR